MPLAGCRTGTETNLEVGERQSGIGEACEGERETFVLLLRPALDADVRVEGDRRDGDRPVAVRAAGAGVRGAGTG